MTNQAEISDRADALRASAERLHGIGGGLDESQLESSAYPSEWCIADVLSHIGSGAVIMRRSLDDNLAGIQTPPDFAQSVWDTWNAKPPADQAADALVSDQALVERIGSLTEEEQGRFQFSLGPMSLDLGGFIGLRLNEHALHTWDVEVALDPSATVGPEATSIVIDNLQMIAGYTAKPSGSEGQVSVQTSGPVRHFTITIEADKVSLEPAEPVETPDLEIPAEAFIRLVYGRLDPEHTPPTKGSADLNQLRQVFPGS